MNLFKKFDEKYGDNGFWQFIKFNMVSFTTSIIQFLLANLLPLFFDSLQVKLPPFLSLLFDPKLLFNGESRYVVDGVVTWGYVLPFFLSNFLANIYSYFVNMKATFKGKYSSKSVAIYLCVLFSLILFSTWLQGRIVGLLMGGPLQALSRTIAVSLCGLLQLAVLFPLEKYVLFKEK